MQQAQKATAEAETQSVGGLRLPRQRGVVEDQLLERVAQVRVVIGVDREEPAEDHRLDFPVAGQRLARGADAGLHARSQGVADPQQRDVLQTGDEVADLAGGELVGGHHLGAEEADVVDVGLGARGHREDRLALAENAVDNPDVGDHAAVLVELGVEDQGPRRSVRVALRRRHARDELLEHLRDALTRLAADPQDRAGVLPDQLRDFARNPLGLGAGQVDLVQAGNQLEARVDRQVGVGDSLRLDALSGIDDQQRALAGGQRTGDLVGEVHVPGRVDQVQLVGLAVPGRVEDSDGLRLDRDAPLALQVHRVEQLRAHLPRGDGVCQLEDAVSERRLAVVDVRDDREVADVSLVHGTRVTIDGVSSGPAGRAAGGESTLAAASRARRRSS